LKNQTLPQILHIAEPNLDEIKHNRKKLTVHNMARLQTGAFLGAIKKSGRVCLVPA
jgi:hypothetical protein